MKLSDITVEKICERGWITPEELVNAFTPFITDFDVKLTRGHELRKDLIMTRIDNFRIELIRRCEKNIERETKREQSNNLGWFSGEKRSKQDDTKQQTDGQVSDVRQGVRERSAGMGSGDSLREDGRDSERLNDWSESSGLGRARPFHGG